MTPELRTAVENSYEVFGRYRLQGPQLCVCRCPSCMHEDVERELVATPLREISAQLLAEYTNSAHAWDDGTVANEMRHFLPRYFELIAAYDPPQYWGLELSLARLREARWRQAWPRDEVDAIEAFFDAFLLNSLLELEHRWPGHAEVFDVEDVVVMILKAGGDVERVLNVWDAAPDAGAAVNMASMRQKITWRSGVPTFHDWGEDLGEAATRIAAFLRRREVDQRLEAAFFKTDNKAWQQVLSEGMG